jgi:hypothetical protein
MYIELMIRADVRPIYRKIVNVGIFLVTLSLCGRLEIYSPFLLNLNIGKSLILKCGIKKLVDRVPDILDKDLQVVVHVQVGESVEQAIVRY